MQCKPMVIACDVSSPLRRRSAHRRLKPGYIAGEENLSVFDMFTKAIRSKNENLELIEMLNEPGRLAFRGGGRQTAQILLTCTQIREPQHNLLLAQQQRRVDVVRHNTRLRVV